MKVIDSYILEIGKHLPRKSRSDIGKEIRSILEDMLEEKATAAGRPADEQMELELVGAYGAPAKVAATYLPENYLIGPRIFPLFIFVVRIVLAVLTGVALIGFSVRFGTGVITSQTFLTQLGKSALEYFGGIATALGNIVLVFVIMERVAPRSFSAKFLEEESWDPAQLTKKPEPDAIHTWEAVLEITLTVLALIVFNIYPEWIKIYYNTNGQWSSLPLFSQALFKMLPWINLTWGLGILLQLSLLRIGRWTVSSRLVEAGKKVIEIGIAWSLLRGPSILALRSTDLANFYIPLHSAETLMKILNVLVIIALINSIIVAAYIIGRNIYKVVVGRKPKE